VGQEPVGGVRKYLSDVLKPLYKDPSIKNLEINKNMVMAGKTYNKGYQLQNLSLWNTKEMCTCAFNLDGKYKTLEGIIGLDDSLNKTPGKLEFWGDGRFIKSIDIEKGSLPQSQAIDLINVKKLEVKFSCQYNNDNEWCKIDMAELTIL